MTTPAMTISIPAILLIENISEIKIKEKMPVKTGIRLENTFALLTPNDFIVIVKKINARVDAKIDNSSRDDTSS
jgi:hypothetical protein